MKKLLIIMICFGFVLVSLTGCATIGGTMKKPALFIDFQYPLKDVWSEAFKVLTSQGLVFEKGNIQEKYFVFRAWDNSGGFPIPIIGIYAVFEDTGKDKTRVEIHYNQDGAIVFYKLENKITHLMTAINTGLMVKNDEEKTRPYNIHDFDKWLDHYKYKSPEKKGYLP